MIETTLVETAHAAVAAAIDTLPLLAGPAGEPAAPAPDTPTGFNTEGVVSFLASKVAPILLAVLGVIFIGRASKGEISKVLTSSAIAIVGLAFIAGAATLFFVGDYLINLMFE
ncbi:hypothetical protein [Micromonospora sp. NBC_01813]|uniref:hypothetical protein n=1 Tax=Micromonospora sp. NBC_01813 TaxID=2975988 RepID=UPI002DD91C54|nr:hypothetical protein [Micromonospora sp. NBC_01813]WSA06749.1 hypothetical protein OG958_20970 [Micromonospora sp. NBC_01813]